MKDHDEERERERATFKISLSCILTFLKIILTSNSFGKSILISWLSYFICFSLILFIVVIVHPVVRSLAFCAGGDRGLQVQIPAGLLPFFFFCPSIFTLWLVSVYFHC